jgi:hypothetical protein
MTLKWLWLLQWWCMLSLFSLSNERILLKFYSTDCSEEKALELVMDVDV